MVVGTICPLGVTTQNDELRARLKGNEDVHKLNIEDLGTTNSEISNHTEIEHV